MLLPRVLPYGQVRTIQLFGLFLTLTTLILVMRLYSRPPPERYEYTEGRTSPWHDWKNTTVATSDEVAYLGFLADTYGLTREVPWFARRIRTKYSAARRLSMTEVPAKFLSRDFRRVRPDDEYLELQAEKALTLPFARSPRPDDIDASRLLFGVSTTAARLAYANYSLVRDYERWLTDGRGASNGATLLLALQATKAEAVRVGRMLLDRGIDAVVVDESPGRDAAARYAELLGRLHRHNQDLTRADPAAAKHFLALVDDDVFFPSLARLLAKLARFRPDDEFYIGAPSEKSGDWVVLDKDKDKDDKDDDDDDDDDDADPAATRTTANETLTTYGGGAVFLTPPMAARLAALPCLRGPAPDDDADAGGARPWDEHLYRCVAAGTDADFHVLPSFYAPTDDAAYGAAGAANAGYGGGLQPLTLHHYRTWHRFDAGRGHQVTAACGEDGFLQRFRFRDDWVLVNGYTLSQYPDGVEAVPLRKAPADVPAEAPAGRLRKGKKAAGSSTAAQRVVVAPRLVVDSGDRPADMKAIAWRGPKRTWRLLDSRVTPAGEVWQAYVKRKGQANSYGDVGEWTPGDAVHTEEGPSNEDSVIVLIWEP